MRTVRLSENDLARIVRRVLREEDEMRGGALPNKDCFSNSKIRVPQSCKVKTTGGMIGTGFLVGKGCLSDLAGMMNMENLGEITKLMACVVKQSESPIRY
jgi:hypothetical protein